MPNLNTVHLLGKITWKSDVRKLKNGNRVTEMGVGVTESFKNPKGDWSKRVHFVDIVLWNDQAEHADTYMKKGDGVLIQGALQYDQWEDKNGEKRSKLRVKANRLQQVQLPERKPE